MKYTPLRELYWAIKTRKLAPDFTIFEYWLWRMYRQFLINNPKYK